MCLLGVVIRYGTLFYNNFISLSLFILYIQICLNLISLKKKKMKLVVLKSFHHVTFKPYLQIASYATIFN